MRNTRISAAILLLILLNFAPASAQRADVTVTLNEQFFDVLLDAVFKDGGSPEFSIASNTETTTTEPSTALSFANRVKMQRTVCKESVKLLREMNGVRTSIRFRDGRILAPLAFSGGYSPPFVGCVDFAGWAETTIDLEFDQPNQRLIAKAHVANVSLNGTGGVGGTVIAKMIQSAIDRKVNPIEIMKLDKISFVVPIQNTGVMKLRATGVRPEVLNGALNVHIAYEFLKS